MHAKENGYDAFHSVESLEPRTQAESDASKWIEAENKELKTLLEMGTLGFVCKAKTSVTTESSGMMRASTQMTRRKFRMVSYQASKP
jgi:hypothetical protein